MFSQHLRTGDSRRALYLGAAGGNASAFCAHLADRAAIEVMYQKLTQEEGNTCSEKN